MTTETISWQAEVKHQVGEEHVEDAIRVIQDLLQDDLATVLSRFASELTLNLRTFRYLAQTLEDDCGDITKEAVLFHRADNSGQTAVTLEEFSRQLQAGVTESKLTIELFSLYVMALAERNAG